ncbi:hypothetical protein MMC31_005556, partial [Peltigera leucophlebia]|nr:hypothetical protein [Peltigera leucophlebia]
MINANDAEPNKSQDPDKTQGPKIDSTSKSAMTVVSNAGGKGVTVGSGVGSGSSPGPNPGPSETDVGQTSRPTLQRRQSWLNNLLPNEKRIDSIQVSSNYLRNLDWSRTFWKPTNGSESMHVLCAQGRDGARVIAQIWVVGIIEFAALVMEKFPTFIIKICITNDDRARLKTGLGQNGNLGDNWSISAIEPVTTLSAKPDFVETMINIMPDNCNKTTAMRILEDKKFQFAYDVRTIPPGEF